MSKRIMGLFVAAAIAGSMFATAGTAAAGAGDAKVWMLNGLPGTTVDVCIDGVEVRSDFLYKQKFSSDLTSEVPHVFDVHAADPGACAGALLLTLDKTFALDANSTIVAGPAEDGTQTMFVFKNKMMNTPRGIARLSVRHTAQVGPLDVRDNGVLFADDLPNDGSMTKQVTAGAHSLKAVLAATGAKIVPIKSFNLAAKTGYQIYVVGNAGTGFSFVSIAQSLRPVVI